MMWASISGPSRVNTGAGAFLCHVIRLPLATTDNALILFCSKPWRPPRPHQEPDTDERFWKCFHIGGESKESIDVYILPCPKIWRIFLCHLPDFYEYLTAPTRTLPATSRQWVTTTTTDIHKVKGPIKVSEKQNFRKQALMERKLQTTRDI